MNTIDKIVARQVLDSRGKPTVEVDMYCGIDWVRAMTPSGASTGQFEAHELRDKGSHYFGQSVLKAVQNVNEIIGPKLQGESVEDQAHIDEILVHLDGTPNKRNLGANAILPVSIATVKMAATKRRIPQFRYIAELAETPRVIGTMIHKKYGIGTTNVGDEGGFVPPMTKVNEPFDLMLSAIKELNLARTVRLGADLAASSFYADGKYELQEKAFTTEEFVAVVKEMIDHYELFAVEDPFEENDFRSFSALMAAKGGNTWIIGDDLTVTNVERLQKADTQKACNAVIIKPNQIGTISEVIQAVQFARSHKMRYIVSHRSGETEDSFIAELAVGLAADAIKLGAPARGERTAKYNELIRIDQLLQN
ncbi:MAG: Isoform 2 of Beta-enolase [Parcubacteria group bacterium GW2011_GWA2_47_8]|nr:MAG: Isoform 2 of Beta-enolase [Parcubacteria group bacterium GW2011_GWA2_47_8]